MTSTYKGKFDNEGRQHGEWIFYHEKKSVEAREFKEYGNYTHGKRVGVWLGFYTSGYQHYQREYNVEGQAHGKWMKYRNQEKGRVVGVVYFENGTQLNTLSGVALKKIQGERVKTDEEEQHEN